jgi:hypothetical protein
LQGGTRFFDVEVRSWWEDKFYQMSRIVFCAVILTIWLYYKKKEYFRGWLYILTNGLGLLENY